MNWETKPKYCSEYGGWCWFGRPAAFPSCIHSQHFQMLKPLRFFGDVAIYRTEEDAQKDYHRVIEEWQWIATSDLRQFASEMESLA